MPAGAFAFPARANDTWYAAFEGYYPHKSPEEVIGPGVLETLFVADAVLVSH